MITYYPKPEETAANIRRFIDHVDRLIIWENTPGIDREAYRIRLPEYGNKILYRSTGKNEGIAYPLNRCAVWAMEEGCTHLLSMDQDSTWDQFEHFVKRVTALTAAGAEIIAMPNVNGRSRSDMEQVESFIISGTLYPLGILKRTGRFNEELFVDGVDLDYSLRLREAGVQFVRLRDGYLYQRFGNPIRSRRLRTQTPNYPAERTYNIVRNHILLYRRYHKVMSGRQKKMILHGYITSRFVKVILLEPDKTNKCIAIIRGCRYGMKKPLPAVCESWNTSL